MSAAGQVRRAQCEFFYPGDLAHQLESFLDEFEVESATTAPCGAVVPHAGWSYSGRTAARTYRTLFSTAEIGTVVLLGTVHIHGVERPSVYPAGSWETPVGSIEIDHELATRLIDGGHIVASECAHDDDHALEVQMPFIHLLAPECKVVPIAMPTVADAVTVGTSIGRELATEPSVAVVASVDLTHYGERFGCAPAGPGAAGERWMIANDRRMIGLIERLDAEAVLAEADENHNTCGPGALAAVLAAARSRGATRGAVIEHTTSRSREPASTPFDSAVGYVGAVLY